MTRVRYLSFSHALSRLNGRGAQLKRQHRAELVSAALNRHEQQLDRINGYEVA